MTDTLSLKEISDAIRSLDICMMTTKNAQGMLESRPMSNNKDVDYNGDSYFFTMGDTRVVSDIKGNPEICLAYDGRKNLLSDHYYICLSGKAHLHTDRATLEKHWVPDLEAWFKNGLDTPGLTLIHVRAEHIRYWKGMEEGEVNVSGLGANRAA